MLLLHRTTALLWLLVLTPLAVAAPSGEPDAAKKKLVLKIATVAPDGSPWVESLREMGTRWRELSDGQVILRIYPSGVSGDESSIVRKIRINLLQGAALTAKGLGEIDSGIWGLCGPLVARNQHEFDLIHARVNQKLLDRYHAKGLTVLGWTKSGWSRWFSTVPIRTPADLKKTKLFMWEGSKTGAIWKERGFQAINLSLLDVPMGLEMGMISSFAVVPLSAAISQWFGLAPYMTDLKWSAMMGGVVIRNDVWESIDPALREKLAAVTQEIFVELKGSADRMENEAIATMQSYGLQIVETTAEEKAEWYRWMNADRHKLRGVLVDEEMYDAVLQIKQNLADSSLVEP